ncbi:MAG: hypothetical protein DRI39_05500 [Chloroflexi bacterium]|nr:MAG: hypothetical protein DRI39_05500 [Chloroflexota bacterium]
MDTSGAEISVGRHIVNKDVSALLHFLGQLSRLYRARFLRPLWQKHTDHNDDPWDALAIFVEGYAFSGKKSDSEYAHAVCEVIRELEDSGTKLTDTAAAGKAWTRFIELVDDSSLSYTDNPMCPRGTEYQRKYRGRQKTVSTARYSVVEFIGLLSSRGEPANIVEYVRANLEHDNVGALHEALCGIDGINGIGERTASLFLRDVATLYDIAPTKERHLLQPVDVWVRHVAAPLMAVEGSDEEVAAWMLEEASRADTSPEAVNQGMWYFGSQVAGSRYRARRALEDIATARTLVDEHVEALSLEVVAWAQARATLQTP